MLVSEKLLTEQAGEFTQNLLLAKDRSTNMQALNRQSGETAGTWGSRFSMGGANSDCADSLPQSGYTVHMNEPSHQPISNTKPAAAAKSPEDAAQPEAAKQSDVPPESGSAATSGPSVKSGDIPPATANRLGLYLRELQHFLRAGSQTIKSTVLGRRLGLSDSQIRRDLALFGEFGKRGVGYNVAGLVGALRKALGTDGQWNTILVGFGNLGNALVRYRGFQEQGFSIRAIFEEDLGKVGGTIEGIPIYDIAHLEEILPGLDVQMAILAVPARSARKLADRLADLGISGILNFAPVSLSASVKVATIDVDLAVELQRLAFAVVNSDRSS